MLFDFEGPCREGAIVNNAGKLWGIVYLGESGELGFKSQLCFQPAVDLVNAS